MLQQPSMKKTADCHDLETDDLRNKLASLRYTMGNMAAGEKYISIAETDSSKNVASFHDMLAILQEECEQLRDQNKMLTQRVQAVEIRLSQTNFVVVELERTKYNNERLRNELLESEKWRQAKEKELARNVLELQTISNEAISLKSRTPTATDERFESPREVSGRETVLREKNPAISHMRKVEKSLRQFVEELLAQNEQPLPSHLTEQSTTEFNSVASHYPISTSLQAVGSVKPDESNEIEKLKDNAREMARRETALRREIEDALLLTERWRDEVDKKTIHETFSENAQTVGSVKPDESNEIEKLKDNAREMARRETALRREIEDALLLTERWRDEVDKKTIHETFSENAQTVGSVKPDESNEIEKLKDNAREMARRETALRREIEDALLLTERWRDEVDKKTIHETFSENAQTVGSVKPDESNEIEKLKDNAREMARRETALRREIEDALLLTERWRDEVDKKTIHETFSENAQTVGSVKPDESNEIEKLKDNAREMARRETALRREIEDALLLTERWRDEVDKKTIHETFSENAQTVGSVKPDESNEIEKLKDNAREMARRETALRREIEDALLLTERWRDEVDKKTIHETFSENAQTVGSVKPDESNEIEKLKDNAREMARRETALRREIEDALLLTERWRDEVDKKTIHETFSENAQTVGSVKPDESNEIEKLKDNAREMARRETALRREIEDALLLTERWRDEVDKKTIHETFSENAQTVGSVKPDESNEIEKLKDNAREMARRETALRREIEDALLLTERWRDEVDKKTIHETFSENAQTVGSVKPDESNEIEKLKDNAREMARRETALRREIEDALLLTERWRDEVDKKTIHETFSENAQTVGSVKPDESNEIEKLKDNAREMARRETALRREIEDALLLTERWRDEVDKKTIHETFSENAQTVGSVKPDESNEIEKLKDNAREMARRETALRREIEDALLLTERWRDEVDKKTIHETFSENAQTVGSVKPDESNEIEKLKDNAREMARRETALRREIEDALLLTERWRDEVDKKTIHETFSENAQTVGSVKPDDNGRETPTRSRETQGQRRSRQDDGTQLGNGSQGQRKGETRNRR
jgi:hypothetical protein